MSKYFKHKIGIMLLSVSLNFNLCFGAEKLSYLPKYLNILDSYYNYPKGSLTLAMGKCLWFSVKIKVCQSSPSSP